MVKCLTGLGGWLHFSVAEVAFATGTLDWARWDQVKRGGSGRSSFAEAAMRAARFVPSFCWSGGV